MASPFPGMDPYLEDPAFWADFHHTFIDCWRVEIADSLPENYDARLDESVNLVQMSPETIKLIYPDIAVSRKSGVPTHGKANGKGAHLLEPETIPHEFLEEVHQARIEILHRPNRTLVAVLELLPPFNKSGEGFDQYRAKRKTILLQKVHLVELDLLLSGKRLPLSRPLPDADYYALVSHADKRPNCDVYHWTVRQPLPTIPIPLRAPDSDLHVDLAKVFSSTYERGRYARWLRYTERPTAPLRANDRRWAQAIAAKKQR